MVVLLSVADSGLAEGLARLAERCAAAGAELVVVLAGSETLSRFGRVQQGVRIVALDAETKTADLRVAGMRACSGDVVALASDVTHAVDWLDNWTRRHDGRRQKDAAGSPLTAAHAG
jgi:hypothetical protein